MYNFYILGRFEIKEFIDIIGVSCREERTIDPAQG